MSAREHKILKKAILVRLSKLGYMAWNNETGVAIPVHAHRPVTYGTPGAPDIMGIIPGGRFIGIEVKTGTARLQKNQRAWKKRCIEVGGLYLTIRSIEQLDRELDSEL